MGKRKKEDDDDGDYEGAGDDDDDDDDEAFVPEPSGGASASDDDDDAMATEKSEDEADKEPAKKKQKTSKTTAKKNDAAEEKKPAAKKKAAPKKGAEKSEKSEKATKSKKSEGGKTAVAAGGKKDAKSKVVPIKSEPEARKLIYDYLQTNNRPYSIQNIIDNLHGRVKKAITQKALDSLVASGKITLKEQGKTKKVYMLNQDGLEVLSPEELGALDEEIRKLKQEKAELMDEIKELTTTKEKASKALTNEELDEAIAKLTADVAAQKQDMERLKTITLATPEEKKEALSKLDKYLKEWRLRKRKAMDIAGYLADNKNVKVKEVLEEVGIETDEDAGVNINEMGKQQQ